MASPPGVFPAPPGVTPNFDNPEYRSGGIVALAAVFIPLAAIFMTLRIYTKLRIIKVFGLEDWTILVAYLCTVFVAISTLVQQKNGNGIHMWDITLDQWGPWNRWGAASVTVFVPAVGLAKVAILLFYLRLNPDRQFRRSVYVVLALTLSYVLALGLAILLQCNPPAKFWTPSIEGKCLDGTKLYLANAILNVIFDFMVLLVPIPMLLRLKVPTRQKVVIGALFSLGSITCIVSAVRIYFSELMLQYTDITWHLPLSTSLSFVEAHLSIICGCVMVLRPFLREHFPILIGNAYRRYKSPGAGGGAYDGPYGPSSRSHYKTKVSAGSHGHGKASSGGGGGGGARSWPAATIAATNHRSHSDDSAVDNDVELAERWGGQYPLRSESEENIIVPAATAAGSGYTPGILKTVDVDVRTGGV
ncbi:MAG: hypothetical protein LQ344_005102 [Seirophora lacunosa]|nr:MAG: hypothetical protein LQ344_005102 [Seirophora lacunosa]